MDLYATIQPSGTTANRVRATKFGKHGFCKERGAGYPKTTIVWALMAMRLISYLIFIWAFSYIVLLIYVACMAFWDYPGSFLFLYVLCTPISLLLMYILMSIWKEIYLFGYGL